MRRMLCSLVAVLVLIPEYLSAQEFEIGLHTQFLVYEDQGSKAVTPRFIVEGYHYLSERTGVWGYGYRESQYVSSVLGLYHDIPIFGSETILGIGLAVGVEVFKNEAGRYHPYLRTAGLVYVGKENLFSQLYYEDGASGEGWLRVDIVWRAFEMVTIGLIHQTGDGTGPRVVLSTNRFGIWGAPVFGQGSRRVLLGMNVTFGR
jgi:hypothetical protein